MKTVRFINMVAVATPLILAVMGLFADTFFLWAMISTMLTGLLQLAAAAGFWYLNRNSRLIRIYFLGVVLFFSMVILDRNSMLAWALPVVLCIFLNVIIYRRPHESN